MSKVYDNSGSLSKNKKKDKDSHPDLKGKATIAGVEYWLSGWRKDGEDGTWYSLSFTPKDDAPAKPAPSRKRPADDDLPDF
jgi:hypothetical protein